MNRNPHSLCIFYVFNKSQHPYFNILDVLYNITTLWLYSDEEWNILDVLYNITTLWFTKVHRTYMYMRSGNKAAIFREALVSRKADVIFPILNSSRAYLSWYAWYVIRDTGYLSDLQTQCINSSSITLYNVQNDSFMSSLLNLE